MGDPYWRYAVPPPERASIPGPSFPGLLTPDASAYTPHPLYSSTHLQSSSAAYLHKDVIPSRTGAYGAIDDINGTSIRGYPSALEDPSLLSQRRDVARGITPGIPDVFSERPSSLRKVNDDPAVKGESNVLFVDGLPIDCLRREVSHLFRPFIGFREIRVVHKESRRTGDKAMVLCFVEFADAKCALTALEALQGYQFDNKKPDSPVLKIHFAHFPFRLPSDRDPPL